MLQPNFRKVAFIFDHGISIAFKSGLYGGRYVPRGCNWGAPYFNSRPSARGDGARRRVVALVLLISIHAPPRGATRVSRCSLRSHSHFNSRPSARGDAIDILDCIPNLFQFTSLREGRLSRPRWIACGASISIHAPPRGATARTISAHTPSSYFNSRPPARGDIGYTV